MQQNLKNKCRFLLLFTLIITSIFSVKIPTSNAHPHLTTESKVAVNGIGPILIGMTIEEAEAAAGIKLQIDADDYEEEEIQRCAYYYPEEESIKRIGFMVSNGIIKRVDINNSIKNTTISGAKVGNTIEEIKSLYPWQIRVEPGHYGGKYLIYEPQDPAYKDYLLLFQTYEGVVHEYRVGYVHEVKYLVEGCS